ncbi:MAG TPA: YihY/virulence factor BrkB family protein [Hyphomicrobiaceae bacterium]|nr:YihY/virulence factor BrkB family protein [Hyphomicrobiaceae bacterium]
MWALLTKAVNGWLRHKNARFGAALAYYSVFSLGPLLLIVTAVAGLFFGAEAARRSITSQFRSMLGDIGSQAVEAMLKGAESATGGGWTAMLGIALLVVAALAVVVQLRDALNTIFECEEPADAGIAWYAKVYALSFAGILALGFLLAVSLIVSAALAAVSVWLSGSAVESALLTLLNFAVSLAVLTLLFSVLFKWLPDRQLAWRDVWLGGFVTALLFNIGKSAIAWYIGTQGFESTYGAAASIVVLLIWVYYSAQIVLFGAELTQAYAARKTADERHA